MNEKIKRYDEEFKKDVVAYWERTGDKAEDVSKHFGISEYTLYSWRKRQNSSEADGVGSSLTRQELEEENKRLKRELDRYQQRCEILKKTLGIISEAPAKPTRRLKR